MKTFKLLTYGLWVRFLRWMGLGALWVHALSAQADGIYMGLGFPGLFNLGYAQAIDERWSWRAEYGFGLDEQTHRNTSDSINGNVQLKASRLGLLGEYAPFQGSFRLVSGLHYNDIQFAFSASGSGNAVINGHTVNLSNQSFEMQIKYPTLTPYIGVGWGQHRKTNETGLGLQSDFGISLGRFNTHVSAPGLVGTQGISQADLDAETQRTRSAISKLTFLPSFSTGLSYRWN